MKRSFDSLFIPTSHPTPVTGVETHRLRTPALALSGRELLGVREPPPLAKCLLHLHKDLSLISSAHVHTSAPAAEGRHSGSLGCTSQLA